MRLIAAASAVILVALVASIVAFVYLPGAAYAASDKLAFSVDQDLVSANSAFAFDIFNELVADEDSSENIFISPFSISTCLAMAYIGSDSTTREAMADVLHFDEFTIEELNDEYQKLIGSLENADSQVTLSIANSAWISQQLESMVKSSYRAGVESYYDAGVFVRDFTSLSTAGEINGWISQETNGMINHIIDPPINPNMLMFLINAIYFKGDWSTQFDPADTEVDDFYLSGGGAADVDMMYTRGDFNLTYHEYGDDHVQVGRLPYGRDKIAMYILLPDENVDINEFTNTLNQDVMEGYIENMGPKREVDVYLPKFDITYGKKRLNDILKNLGMDIAFDPVNADFSNMANVNPSMNVFISFVDHKAVIKVNEEGTEAAAVTVVGMGVTSAVPTQPDVLRVDRPFFFVIRDDRSGSILFMGKVMDPTAD